MADILKGFAWCVACRAGEGNFRADFESNPIQLFVYNYQTLTDEKQITIKRIDTAFKVIGVNSSFEFALTDRSSFSIGIEALSFLLSGLDAGVNLSWSKFYLPLMLLKKEVQGFNIYGGLGYLHLNTGWYVKDVPELDVWEKNISKFKIHSDHVFIIGCEAQLWKSLWLGIENKSGAENNLNLRLGLNF